MQPDLIMQAMRLAAEQLQAKNLKQRMVTCGL